MSLSSKLIKPMLIGSDWITREVDPLDSMNPATGDINFKVSSASEEQVNAAVAVAKEASQKSAWRNMLPHLRARILQRIADGIEANADMLAQTQMIENGKIYSECKEQAKSAAATYRYFAAVCETLGSEVTPSRGKYFSMTVYEPFGVVAAITPWNSPLTMEAQKVAPALAAGNSVVVKPSEITPSTSLAVAQIALDAGLPPGILNVIPGTGAIAGRCLVAHPGVCMISFTGGTSTGRSIAKAAADRLIPVGLELGGKSPHIIFEDAELGKAVKSVATGIFEGSGQSCVAGSRLFIQRSIYNTVMNRLVAHAQKLKIDMPNIPGAEVGPLASFNQRNHIESIVEKAHSEGGHIVFGGTRPSNARLAAGAFYTPTIISDLHNDSTATQEEIFGPVLCTLVFDDEADLIAQANNTAFGLAAGIWTADYQRAWRIARAIDAGTVWINTYKQLSIATPFGGFKNSGIGREKGLSGVRMYQQCKALYWHLEEVATTT